MRRFAVEVMTHLNDVVVVDAEDEDDAMKRAQTLQAVRYPDAALVEATNVVDLGF